MEEHTEESKADEEVSRLPVADLMSLFLASC
jgi:hypothetical protein